MLSSAKGRYDYHPIYIAVAEIEYNNGDDYATLLCKVFPDDLQRALQKRFNNQENLFSDDSSKISKDINSYIKEHLQIKINDAMVNYSFQKFFPKENAVVCSFRINAIKQINKIELTDNIFYEIYDSQIEIANITVNGNRKSNRVRNPASKMSFEF